MTDVVTTCSGNAPVYNNRVTVFNPSPKYNRGNNIKSYGLNVDITPISGVNSITTNGYLDIRFDNPTYYSN